MNYTIQFWEIWLERAQAKSQKLIEDLKVTSSTNTQLGFENKVPRILVDALVAAKDVVKMKLYATLKDVKRAKLRATMAKGNMRATDEVWRLAKDRVASAENSIALLNRDFDAIVLGKDKQLGEAMEEVQKSQRELASPKT
ncbi:hypothetical protein Adt_39203 [Abeliophyllum distichum]|uniref:Uncharacterized protein n=1 Tax=Abeliophyllum distichum TaxID=126358 RepID=A0ABD1Q5G8_9LAMI